MSYILNIESSGKFCSVALAKDKEVISIREDFDGRSHAVKLATFISEVLKEGNVDPSHLNAVAVSKGPGSYTGLRIGVSTAKGMAYALKIPLIGVNTLTSMAHGFLKRFPEFRKDGFLLCPMIDARRMEVYTRFYSILPEPITEVKADIIDSESYTSFLNKYKVVFFGSGAEKCKKTIVHDNAIFIDEFEPSSAFMTLLSFNSLSEEKYENTAYFEPFYLKDFVATIPRTNVFG